MKTNEENKQLQFDVVKEIENYNHRATLLIVDRDGENFFIECPDCHSTDLNSMRLISCKKCHTHFTLYFEDGFKDQDVFTDGYPVSDREKVKIIALKGKNDYFKHILYPKYDNDGDLKKLKDKYPEMRIITIYRDLHNGKDAHQHQKYKKYALIPLN